MMTICLGFLTSAPALASIRDAAPTAPVVFKNSLQFMVHPLQIHWVNISIDHSAAALELLDASARAPIVSACFGHRYARIPRMHPLIA